MKKNTYFRPDEVIEQKNIKIKVVKETIKPKPQQPQLPSEFYVS